MVRFRSGFTLSGCHVSAERHPTSNSKPRSSCETQLTYPCSMYGKFIVDIWLMFRSTVSESSSFISSPMGYQSDFSAQPKSRLYRHPNAASVKTWRTNPITNMIDKQSRFLSRRKTNVTPTYTKNNCKQNQWINCNRCSLKCGATMLHFFALQSLLAAP